MFPAARRVALGIPGNPHAVVPVGRAEVTQGDKRRLNLARRARVSPEPVGTARDVPGRWRLLTIADDWCGDAVNILPVVARLAERTSNGKVTDG